MKTIFHHSLTVIACIYLLLGTLLLDPIVLGCALAILIYLRRYEQG